MTICTSSTPTVSKSNFTEAVEQTMVCPSCKRTNIARVVLPSGALAWTCKDDGCLWIAFTRLPKN
jgi:ribosomal protein L37AE/L43A